MAYHLLTGATGLLGRYLLRNMLLDDLPVAVVIRPSRRAKVQQRVEEVMGHWDQQAGRALPRPVVLEGDISEPGLGLDARSTAWVAANCSHVLHNAASLTFQSEGPEGEPWLSNVAGTRNVLGLCRTTGIRQFHHVSTAYVCGLRTGRVLESELDVGQQFGNDYEQTKVQAEKMVREADFLDRYTIFRPSIIVGDSQTGYTTTFHGFYTPLQLAHAAAKQGITTAEESANSDLLSWVKMTGNDRKNLVPVDWVAAVTSFVVAHDEHHGRTYHLTAPNPTPVRVMREVIERCMQEFAEPQAPKAIKDPKAHAEMLGMFMAGFVEQMKVYQAYWRDDPKFDVTNTMSAVPHLPCPVVDRELLMRTAAYAIRANFGWPRPEPAQPEFDVHRFLEPLVQAGQRVSRSEGTEGALGLQVNGPGGGQWNLVVRNGTLLGVDWGLGPRLAPTYYLNAKTFASLARGQVTVEQSVNAGRVIVEANGLPFPTLMRVLQQVTTSTGSTHGT
jgi:thioester reductase-like protein